MPGKTIEQLAHQLGADPAWLQERYDDPFAMYEILIIRCVRDNPEYTEEEIRHMAREK